MNRLVCTIDDVEIADAGKLKVPGLRVNYFNVPWTLSNPGHGRLLMTSEALEEFNDKLPSHGKSVLKIKDGEHEINLKVFATKAEPLWGHFSKGKGLYVLEVQDERCIDAMRVVDDVNNGKLAVYNVKKLDGEWVQNTLKSEDVPWTLEDIIKQALTVMDYGEGVLPVAFPTATPQSVYLGCVPANLAADLLLLTLGERYAFRYDPETETAYACSLGDIQSIDFLVQDNNDRIITGGKGKIYPAPCIPEQLLNYTDLIVGPSKKDEAIRNVSISRYYVTGATLADTYVPTLTNRTVSGSTGSNWFQWKLNSQYRYAFAGFIPEFLNNNIPLEQIIYTWQGGYPITEIHTGIQSPAQAVTSSPYYYKSRGIPHRLFIGGDIFLPEGEMTATEGGGGAWGKIQECDKNSGWARVQLFTRSVNPISESATPSGEVIYAWNGPEAWHRKDDIVFCVKSTTGNPPWVILDKVKGYAWEPPTEWIFRNYQLELSPTCCADNIPGLQQ